MKKRRLLMVMFAIALIAGSVFGAIKFSTKSKASGLEAAPKSNKMFSIGFYAHDDWQEEAKLFLTFEDGTGVGFGYSKNYISYMGAAHISTYDIQISEDEYKKGTIYVNFTDGKKSLKKAGILEDGKVYSVCGDTAELFEGQIVGETIRLYYKTDWEDVTVRYNNGDDAESISYEMVKSAYDGYYVYEVPTTQRGIKNITFVNSSGEIDNNNMNGYDIYSENNLDNDFSGRLTILNNRVFVASPIKAEDTLAEENVMVAYEYSFKVPKGENADDLHNNKIVVKDYEGNIVESGVASYKVSDENIVTMDLLVSYNKLIAEDNQLVVYFVNNKKEFELGDFAQGITPFSEESTEPKTSVPPSYERTIKIYYKTKDEGTAIRYKVINMATGVSKYLTTEPLMKTLCEGYYVAQIILSPEVIMADRNITIINSNKEGLGVTIPYELEGETISRATVINGKCYLSNVIRNLQEKGVEVYYKTDWINAYAHYKIGDGEWTKVPGNAMSVSNEEGYSIIRITEADKNNKITICFNNGQGYWDNNFESDYVLTGSDKYTIDDNNIYNYEPDEIPNNIITVYYKSFLDDTYIHYKAGKSAWTTEPGVKMTKSLIGGYAVATIELGKYTNLKACFNDGKGNWDNNGGYDYSFNSAGTYTIENGKIEEGVPFIPERNMINIVYSNSELNNYYIHYKIGNGSWTEAPGEEMLVDAIITENGRELLAGYMSIDLQGNNAFTCCFNDGNGKWDNNNKNDYYFEKGGTYYILDGKLVSQTEFYK